MVLRKFMHNRRVGWPLKVFLISSSLLAVFTVLRVPGKFDDNIIIQQTSLSFGDSLDSFKYDRDASSAWEKVPTHRQKGTLPDFSNGGVVVFYHVYKTGGSTVGKLLHEIAKKDQDNFKEEVEQDKDERKPKLNIYQRALKSPAKMFFTMIRKHVDWERDCLKTLDLASQNKKLLLLELHVEDPAPDFPSLVELSSTIDRWRAEADRRGVGFFSFTLVREPVAHALSFFNFFHVGNNCGRPPPSRNDHDAWNPFKPLSSTESNFLKSYYANNRQCRMLSSDPQSTRAAPQVLVWRKDLINGEDLAESRQPCAIDEVHNSLFNSMDWVGTTEKLSNETLPLLTQIVLNDPRVGRDNKPFKVFDNNPNHNVGMKAHDLSNETMAAILERTELDRVLYADVGRHFKLSNLGWDYHSPLYG
ncbi:unnamed protein product [Pseudo-nitzschia multistriata]|uniref:Uncharacterized protein n=1 Tax=Pseudo-nitzschia multistriata TaxID=183589 RepID=A0A448YV30_9STRA|nr:unnamed protein product [Pseudo-nitzschia multistriata]